ncbi:hypothetical protein AB1J28_05820 [Lysinibacillus irui]|uniref:hypothetical protein n=1 Tax=Lysinibacillus irui TaxID=2998077 RepID=UPI003D2B6F2E
MDRIGYKILSFFLLLLGVLISEMVAVFTSFWIMSKFMKELLSEEAVLKFSFFIVLLTILINIILVFIIFIVHRGILSRRYRNLNLTLPPSVMIRYYDRLFNFVTLFSVIYILGNSFMKYLYQDLIAGSKFKEYETAINEISRSATGDITKILMGKEDYFSNLINFLSTPVATIIIPLTVASTSIVFYVLKINEERLDDVPN